MERERVKENIWEVQKYEKCVQMSEKQLGPFRFHRIIILIHHRFEIIPSAVLLPVFHFGLSFAHFLSDPAFASKHEHSP